MEQDRGRGDNACVVYGPGVWEAVPLGQSLEEKGICQDFPGRQNCESKDTKMSGVSWEFLVVSELA